MHAHPAAAECLRSRLRSRAVKRAYFILTFTAMHAYPVRRRTAPVSYVRRHAPCGALYGYYIKIYKFFFLSNFAAPASCRSRLRSRAVKRAYFILTFTAMHAHPVRRRGGAGFLRSPPRPLRCALRLLY